MVPFKESSWNRGGLKPYKEQQLDPDAERVVTLTRVCCHSYSVSANIPSKEQVLSIKPRFLSVSEPGLTSSDLVLSCCFHGEPSSWSILSALVTSP